MPRIADIFAAETLRLHAGVGMQPGGGLGSQGVPGGTAPKMGQQPGQSPAMQQQPEQDPDLMAAPYVKLLTKLGYEFQGVDQDEAGAPIGQSFQGPDGDMILVKQDGSWVRFGPGAQRAQGPDVVSMGHNLVKNALQQGDDEDHHTALRQSGYQKIHQDDQGNAYYKHPQHGKSVTVRKDGKWGSSVGTGRGAGKLREFLGNEQMESEDPQMQKMKLQRDQMKQQQQMQQQGMGKPKVGTRGGTGTRPQAQPLKPKGMGRI